MQLTLSGRIVEGAKGSVLPVPDFIRMARETGYEAVDLRYSQIGPDVSEALLSQVERALRDSGIAAAQLNAGGMADDRSLETLRKIAGAAQRLGCRTIRISGPVAMCAKAADLVQPLGIRLTAQLHTGGEYETIALARATLEKVGRANYGVIIEPANLLMARQPCTRQGLEPIAKSLFGVHIQSLIVVGPNEGGTQLKLSDGTPVYYQRVPLGENTQFDLQALFSELKALGFDGFVNVLEPLDPAQDSAVVARKTAEVLRPWIS